MPFLKGMTLQTPLTFDPTIVGQPADLCLTCFSPLAYDYRFCENCGSTHLFGYGDFSPGQLCKIHPKVLATAICRSCNNPICDDCTGARGRPLFSPQDDAECKRCIERIDTLKKSFRDRLDLRRICAKHQSQSATLRCGRCGLPHCDSCLYFTRKWARTRLAEGPLCLPCFRMQTVLSSRNTWISAREARARGLLRNVDPRLVV